MVAYRDSGEREKGHGYDCDGFHGFAIVFHDVAIVLCDDVEGLGHVSSEC